MRYFFNYVTFHNDYVTKTYGYFFDFVLTLFLKNEYVSILNLFKFSSLFIQFKLSVFLSFGFLICVLL